MQVKVISALAVLILSVSTAMMQDVTSVPTASPSSLGVIVYMPATGALERVTAEGVTPLADLSAMADPENKQKRNLFKLSPDHTKLLFVADETLYSADVATGTCCEEFVPLEPQPVLLFKGGETSFLFSPDGRQVAATYYSLPLPDAERMPGKVIVYDIATGKIVARLDGSRLKIHGPNDSFEPAIMMVRWTDEGILVQPYCLCGGGIDGMAQFWNPVDDTVSESLIYYDVSEEWLVTGEGLRAIQDQSFSFDPSGQFPSPNVVVYLPAAADEDSVSTPQVIYFNPNNLNISWVMDWVADGHAVLIQHYDQSAGELSPDVSLVLRDGTKIPMTWPMTRQYMAPTTDGWIMRDTEAMTLVYYRLNGKTVEEIVLDAPYTGFPYVVETILLGASVLPGSVFPTVTAP